MLSALAWVAFAFQLLVGVLVLRHKGPVTLIAFANLAAAGAVLVYWGWRWIGYLSRGITWYGTDQLAPACAVVVCLLAGLTLAGRYQGVVVH